jgi:23S rRNA (adenine2503-C2)-methyltransferase
MKKDVLSLTLEELRAELKNYDIPSYRTIQLFEFLHNKLVSDFRDVTVLPKEIRTELGNKYEISRFEISGITESKISDTKKYLFSTRDKSASIESVFMGYNGRVTYCISSQSGCNAGCVFCATGYLGLIKNLTAGEIVSQVYEMNRETKTPPTNIVFMGMGEPFLNYENVIKALKILTSDYGLKIPARRITVSTIGIKQRIINFTDDITAAANKSLKNTKLAVSLHSTKDKVRNKLIPLSGKYELKSLYKDLIYYYRKTCNKITYEYIFFDGLNNQKDDVKNLTKLAGMLPCNINVIPYHPIGNIKPGVNEIDEFLIVRNNSLSKNNLNDFINELRNKKVTVNIRPSSGLDINAACGQLAANQKQNI